MQVSLSGLGARKGVVCTGLEPETESKDAAGSRTEVTPASLRAEGVLEVGRAAGMSVLYVLTRVKLHLLHLTWVPDRRLDDYAITLALNWIENGMPSYEVAGNLGVQEDTLRHALLAAGYERALPVARGRSKKGARSNRRGRFMRRAVAHASS